MTKIIIGLGNPGEKYKNTRHNIGFYILDTLAQQNDTTFKPEKHKTYEKAEIEINNEKVILIKPLTFMNNSGQAAQKAIQFYKLTPEDILVIHDELDLPFKTIRYKEKGSAGTHNGLKSIVNHIGKNFQRIKIGIENRTPEQKQHFETSNYVLGKFTREEAKALESITKAVTEKIQNFK